LRTGDFQNLLGSIATSHTDLQVH